MRIRTTLVGIVALVYLCQPGQRIVATPLFQGSAEYYYQQGNEYLKADKCAEAVDSFKRAIAISPASGAYNDLGRAYMCLLKFSDAETSFKQALRIKPENVNALFNLGIAYAHQVKIDEANNVRRQLERIDPEKAKRLQSEITEASEAGRQIDEDKKILRAALEKADITEGDKFYDAKDYVKAIESYKKAIARRPSSYAYNGLGLSYDALKQYTNAVSATEEAIRLEPGDSQLHYNLAFVLIHMEAYEKAEGPIREALRLQPDFVDAINLQGVVYNKRKQYAEALVQFQKALRLKPNDPIITHNVGKTLFQLGRKAEAEQVYKKLVTLDKESAQKLYDFMHPAAVKKDGH